MWWYILKMTDFNSEVVYAYGLETKNPTGKIRFDRKTEEFKCLKLADGDTERGYEYLLPHLYRAIVRDGAPHEKQIAIG